MTTDTTTDTNEPLPLPVTRVPGEGECSSYRPGHNAHPTQARLAFTERGRTGRLHRTGDTITFEPTDGTTTVLHTHDPRTLPAAYERFGPDDWRISYDLLVHGEGDVGISVTTELGPCTFRTTA
jgi:hypothetical protein